MSCSRENKRKKEWSVRFNTSVEINQKKKDNEFSFSYQKEKSNQWMAEMKTKQNKRKDST